MSITWNFCENIKTEFYDALFLSSVQLLLITLRLSEQSNKLQNKSNQKVSLSLFINNSDGNVCQRFA